jgi:aspartate/methionine/tyrosine aminotransferase
MSQGVPGVSPPQLLLDRLSEYSAAPSSCGYTSVAGEISLRETLAQEMKFVYGSGTDVCADDITLTAGCNMAFVATIMVLADPGDEVILPVPWYIFFRSVCCSLYLITLF